jgi:hypothetical protein
MTTGMRRPSVREGGRRLLALAAFGLALVLLLAACGRASGSGIATAGGGRGPAPAGTNTTPAAVDPRDAALVYAQCIRANGYPEWPDPNADGQIMITRGQGMNDPRRLAAMEKCQHLRPAGAGGGGFGAGVGPGGPPGPGLGDAEQALAFARCMRQNGVTDFPDPPPGGGPTIVSGQSGINPNDPRFQVAVQTCRASVLGGAR